jgi:hypothetical protein
MAMQETTTVRRALRALERHRERFRDNFDSMAQRNLEKALDDNWLSRKLALNNE